MRVNILSIHVCHFVVINLNIFFRGGVMKKRVLTALAVLTGLFLLSASIVWAAPAPVARTGQTKCYADNGTEISCSGTFRDGDFQMGVPWPDPRFTDNGDETVTDKLTGLMWRKDANAYARMEWSVAIDTVKQLRLGSGGCSTGYSDWRLPNIKELQSLIDYGNYNVVLLSDHPFSNVLAVEYWSSTTSQRTFSKGDALILSMGDGQTEADGKHASHRVWPVRGGANLLTKAPVAKTGQTVSYHTWDDGDLQKGTDWPDPRFKDNEDGTVTDRLTGLMWTKDANINGYMNWPPAMDYAHDLSLGEGCGGRSYSDWRMPNVKELLSLIDYGNYNPVLASDHPFSNVNSVNTYWSSTDQAVEVMKNKYKCVVSMRDGRSVDRWTFPSVTTYTWAVRGGN
jgi:hypothetical protein